MKRILVYCLILITEVCLYGQPNTVNSPNGVDISDTTVFNGYSVISKDALAGNITVINAKELSAYHAGNLLTQLNGRVAGLYITGDGNINSQAKVNINGFGTLYYKHPLYIVDGVPVMKIEDIDPDDIENVTVLKDASNTALYGSRGANGVLIITTRKAGKPGLRFYFDSYLGISWFPKGKFPELLNAEELGSLRYQSQLNAGLTPMDAQYFNAGEDQVTLPEYTLAYNGAVRLGGAQLRLLESTNNAAYNEAISPLNYDYRSHPVFGADDTDWFDEVYNSVPVDNVQIALAGAWKSANFRATYNRFHQKQVSDSYSYYTRHSIRLNSDFRIKRFIRIGENFQVKLDQGRDIGHPGSAWTMPALLPVWDIAGNPTGGRAPAISGTSDNDNGNNPLAIAYHDRFDQFASQGAFKNMTGNVFGEITFLKDLYFLTSFGLNNNYWTEKDVYLTRYEQAEGNSLPNSVNWTSYDYMAWNWSNLITYNKTISDHTFRLLLGTEVIHFSVKSNSSMRDGYVTNDYIYYLLPSGISGLSNNRYGFNQSLALISVFGNLDYGFKQRYLLNATYRRDKYTVLEDAASSWGAGLGWRISNESFMKDINWLTELKVFGGYGMIKGQNYLDEIQIPSTDYPENYPIGAGVNLQYGGYHNRLGNEDAKWEKTATTNFGFNTALFNGGLNIDFNYFINTTSDLLVPVPYPVTEPPPSIVFFNSAAIKNKGFNLNITYGGRLAGEVDYVINANFYAYKNEVIKIMDNPALRLYGGGTRMGNATVTMAGEEISSYYGWKLDGFIDDATELSSYITNDLNGSISNTWLTPRVGGWKIKDISGPSGSPDGVINDYDRVILGSPHPDFQMAFNLNLNWKCLDFSAILFWSQGGELFNYSRYYVDFNTYLFNRSKRMLYESWTEDNHNAKLPKLSSNDYTSARYVTDYYIEDASYIRLKSLQIGCSLPEKIAQKVRLEQLRIYVQAQNLFTWSKSTALDPSLGLSGDNTAMGILHNYTPTPAQFIMGINLGI